MVATALERGTERGRQRVDAYASKECWAHEQIWFKASGRAHMYASKECWIVGLVSWPTNENVSSVAQHYRFINFYKKTSSLHQVNKLSFVSSLSPLFFFI
jgi:hypothetical protein